MLKIAILSQMLNGAFVVSGRIENLTTGETKNLGASKSINLGASDILIPSYEGAPDFNYVEYINLAANENEVNLHLNFSKVDSLISNEFNFALTNKNFNLAKQMMLDCLSLTLMLVI